MGKYRYPFPEILAPGCWTIRHVPQGGHSGRATRILAAPLFDTPLARAIRDHELAHVRFSPARVDPERLEVRRETLLAVEDARVNECAVRSDLAEVMADLDDPSIEIPDPRADLRGAVLFLVGSHGTRGFARVRSVLEGAGDAGAIAVSLGESAVAPFREAKGIPKFLRTVEVARMLDRVLEPSPPPVLDGLDLLEESALGALRGGRPESVPPSKVAWGALRRVEEPPRTVLVPGALAPRRSGATEEGFLLRLPHRLFLDGRVFARRRRAKGGTVLVDASGSMGLKPKDLLAIVAAVPGAEVACYEGTAEGWGVLRILARGGRRVPDEQVAPPLGKGANVIDGPALRWLATRPAPRIWVSDGMVRGVGDRASPDLDADALRICRSAGIVRVPDAKGAAGALRGLSPGPRPPAAPPPPAAGREPEPEGPDAEICFA